MKIDVSIKPGSDFSFTMAEVRKWVKETFNEDGTMKQEAINNRMTIVDHVRLITKENAPSNNN